MNNQNEYSTCRECSEDYLTEDLNDAMVCYVCDHICVEECVTPCSVTAGCKHDRVECPEHEGNFDCNPFCALCEGEQEYCPTCEQQGEQQ